MAANDAKAGGRGRMVAELGEVLGVTASTANVRASGAHCLFHFTNEVRTTAPGPHAGLAKLQN